MSLAVSIGVADTLTARQEMILGAAETCFVNAGFHRTTMQDIAKAAAMSPANIYRYFDSKQAVVIGIAHRERIFARAFISQLDLQGDPHAALMGIVKRYYFGLSQDAAIMRLEIWSEANRNSSIATTLIAMEEERRTWIVERLSALATSPRCDPQALYEAINFFLKGVVVSKALVSSYEDGPALAQFTGILDAGLSGELPGVRKLG
ncbi:TetR/AcrR family transcriptional regulator [Lichenihabitans psoromatis]|uniref:TetR/AcrR family transcriptional regulator n=1 Tax=Lichenihabitans psoromatis TaxID=2528642 RepID=UPI001035DDBD|nr:TetR/AcrR family transcriptional regulator [Lichenihabitans psoromatis]